MPDIHRVGERVARWWDFLVIAAGEKFRERVIVVDGRGYENNSQEKKEIHNLVDVIEDTRNADKIYEEIMKRSEEIVRKIALKIVPETAERIIKEEIEKIRKTGDAE